MSLDSVLAAVKKTNELKTMSTGRDPKDVEIRASAQRVAHNLGIDRASDFGHLRDMAMLERDVHLNPSGLTHEQYLKDQDAKLFQRDEL